jgi:hypothetical protein
MCNKIGRSGWHIEQDLTSLDGPLPWRGGIALPGSHHWNWKSAAATAICAFLGSPNILYASFNACKKPLCSLIKGSFCRMRRTCVCECMCTERKTTSFNFKVSMTMHEIGVSSEEEKPTLQKKVAKFRLMNQVKAKMKWVIFSWKAV